MTPIWKKSHKQQTQKTVEQRFIEKVSIRGDNECWEWLACRMQEGYGEFRDEHKRMVRAHRYAYYIWKGAIPNGMDVLHTCDNPPCCNPNHLFLGTQDENMKDRKRKGKYAPKYGQLNPQARLTTEQIPEIHALYAEGITQSEIALRYGVSQSQISLILSNKRRSRG